MEEERIQHTAMTTWTSWNRESPCWVSLDDLQIAIYGIPFITSYLLQDIPAAKGNGQDLSWIYS